MSPKKRIPTKSELVQLQKLYKTDEKIGERLGGVAPYLVAYWRRKKNVPKHSLPKFSEKEILNLWERYGDDDKCGLELGISKAAFYNWRRRYGIKEKPAFLKLEQLEFNFPGLKMHSATGSLYNKQTVAQKILARIVELEKVEVGQQIHLEPDLVVSSANTAAIIEEFRQYGAEYVWNPGKIMVALANCFGGDNRPEMNKTTREFVRRQGIKNFYDVTEGTCHQVAVEKGLILPGHLIFGADRHSITYGCLSALATDISNKEMASVWATGKTKYIVPKTIRVDINGRRTRGVYAKDIALLTVKQLAAVDVTDKVIEFYGNVVTQMSISERFTLTNISMDMGIRAAICPFDATTRRYLTARTGAQYAPVIADRNASYDQLYQINIDHLTPQLARPGLPDEIRPVSEREDTPVQLVVLGTGSNGRFDDLRIAADILKGRQVNPDCRLLIYPGSRSVYLEALKKGLIRVFIEAGAVVMYPGYGQSFGGGNTLLASGERALFTTNSRITDSVDLGESEIYLCSPATAAASAVNGAITNPARYVK